MQDRRHPIVPFFLHQTKFRAPGTSQNPHRAPIFSPTFHPGIPEAQAKPHAPANLSMFDVLTLTMYLPFGDA